VELRETFRENDDLVIVYVVAQAQLNDKALRWMDGLGLRQRVRFALDPDSAAIEALGVLKRDPEPMEEGVPHPTTYLLDREGRVRFVDVREDFHIWIDPAVLVTALAEIP